MKNKPTPETAPPKAVEKEETIPMNKDQLLARLAKQLEGLPILEDLLLQQKQDKFDELNR